LAERCPTWAEVRFKSVRVYQFVDALVALSGPSFSYALVAERLKALVCNTSERKLHVSSNLTECSNTSVLI
jgi:hypothetical protein